MSSLLDSLMQHLGGDTMRQLSQQLGTDPATTSTAVSAALPALLSALARNAQTPAGAGALATALDKDHDGSVLNDLPGLLGGAGAGGAGAGGAGAGGAGAGGAGAVAGAGGGAGILKHVFGGKQDMVAQGVGTTAGMGSEQSKQLLAMLAPIVMGVLGSAKRSNGLDAGGLAAMLGNERKAIGQQSGGALGSLMQMIDRDGDGSVVDDIGGMLGKMMGR